jgi:hypothetical protein
MFLQAYEQKLVQKLTGKHIGARIPHVRAFLVAIIVGLAEFFAAGFFYEFLSGFYVDLHY